MIFEQNFFRKLRQTQFSIPFVVLAFSTVSTSAVLGDNEADKNEIASPIDLAGDCSSILAAPPFVDILTKNEGRDYGEISVLKSGRNLLGLECSVENLVDFFSRGGWEFRRYEEHQLSGPSNENFGLEPYYFDGLAFFCKQRRSVYSLFLSRCVYVSTVAFREGRISNINAQVFK